MRKQILELRKENDGSNDFIKQINLPKPAKSTRGVENFIRLILKQG